MPDDLHKEEQLFLKSILSYKGYIPSADFNGEQYALYLEYASAVELEMDTVSEATYRRIYPEKLTQKLTNAI
jgi:hypothetical protein